VLQRVKEREAMVSFFQFCGVTQMTIIHKNFVKFQKICNIENMKVEKS
jgi:hypothetical protein